MKLTIESNGKSYHTNLDKGVQIGIPIQRTSGIRAWGLGSASYTAYDSDQFTGSVANGGPCNVEIISFVPHTNGTHTECYGHITEESKYVLEEVEDTFYLAKLITLPTKISDENFPVLDFNELDFGSLQHVESLVIRSLPNDSMKLNLDYTSTNPASIDKADMQKIVDAGVSHLVIDLPSVDPESDGGKLAAHRVFWQTIQGPIRKKSSITEFAYIPDYVKDGDYILKLNISPFESDASPSKPILYPLN